MGSGIAGGWAAMELTRAGLDVLLLEAGRSIDPATDYTEHLPAAALALRGLGDRRFILSNHSVQRRCELFNEYSHRFFVNDLENPYSTPADLPFLFIRGRQIGGRSLTWGRRAYRLGPLDFGANALEGVGTPWPLDYAELAPWYDHVEDFIGVSGNADGIAQIPDGRFLPPMKMSCGEELLRGRAAAKWGNERQVTISRTAVLTRDHNGRKACHYCGPCERGCATGSYFSTPGATLPVAMATGKLTVRPHSVVRNVHFDPKKGRLSGVAVVDAVTEEEIDFKARLVFLCASTIESTRILLNSAGSRFPRGVANGSGMLGRNLMDHVCNAGAAGSFPELSAHGDPGVRPTGIYVPRWENVRGVNPAFLRGFGLQGESRRHGIAHSTLLRPRLTDVATPGFGAAFKEEMRTAGRWRVSLSGFGECLPNAANRVEIHPTLHDRWKIPSVHITMRWGANERAIDRAMRTGAAEILEACGAKDVRLFGSEGPSEPGLAIHEMGTARMGDDPQTSVLNRWNQAHEIPNLFVTDGSCMPSSGTVGPSLTYMALTARACDYAVRKLKAMEL